MLNSVINCNVFRIKANRLIRYNSLISLISYFNDKLNYFSDGSITRQTTNASAPPANKPTIKTQRKVNPSRKRLRFIVLHQNFFILIILYQGKHSL